MTFSCTGDHTLNMQGRYKGCHSPPPPNFTLTCTAIQSISLSNFPAPVPGKFMVCTGHMLQCRMPNRTNHKFPRCMGQRNVKSAVH